MLWKCSFPNPFDKSGISLDERGWFWKNRTVRISWKEYGNSETSLKERGLNLRCRDQLVKARIGFEEQESVQRSRARSDDRRSVQKIENQF